MNLSHIKPIAFPGESIWTWDKENNPICREVESISIHLKAEGPAYIHYRFFGSQDLVSEKYVANTSKELAEKSNDLHPIV